MNFVENVSVGTVSEVRGREFRARVRIRKSYAKRCSVRAVTARWWWIGALVLAASWPLGAQDDGGGLLTENPLDRIRDELIEVLDAAGVPFSEEQQDRITFVLEESRRASEQLFGNVMNFSGGPPQGEALDRALAGIAWMNEDFSDRVRVHLTAEQLAAWDAHVAARAAETAEPDATAGTSRQVQQIRINRNPFTAENQFSGNASSGGSYSYASGGGIQTRIFQRGGAGALHGSAGFTLRDESLNARNPFAPNKPPYQQRNVNLTGSGPLIRNRLTVNGSFTHQESDSADTVNAQTLDGPFVLGFTRPQSTHYAALGGTYQLTPGQSLDFRGNLQRHRREMQNVGGFNLPERAIDLRYRNDNVNVQHLWFVSERWVQEIRVGTSDFDERVEPVTIGRAINVLGAFNGGGGQSRGAYQGRDVDVASLWIYSGDRWAVRAGGNMNRNTIHANAENNFRGTFTFSDLESFGIGRPILYTETRGDPTLRRTQTEWSAFYQNEFQPTDRWTLFFGVRYERQTNLDDHNNLDPRVGIAFALDSSTVLRAGVGLFHVRIPRWVEYDLARLDGTRQVEIVISNPSYPDPFLAGEVRVVPPSSRRVRADDLVAPYSVNSSYQIERSFPGNLFVTAAFDYHKRFHLLRSRNLNPRLPACTAGLPDDAPRAEIQSCRPDPMEGNVWRLESTGIAKFKAIRVNMRQRFSIFNVNATYSREVNGNVLTNFSAPTDNFNLRGDYAETVRHQFSAGVNNRLFWDVYLNTTISYRNGNWYTITTGEDDNGDGVTNDRPPGVPRSSERGPHQGNVSFNLTKSVSLGSNGNGGPSLNFRANFNNAFNRTNFGTPVGILTSPNFGKSISASNPRQITLEVRFQF